MISNEPSFWVKLKSWWNGRCDGKSGYPTKKAKITTHYEKDIASQFKTAVRNQEQDFHTKESGWSKEAQNLTKESGDVERDLEVLRNRMVNEFKRSHLDVKMSKIAYWVLLAFLVLFEIPINSVVFDVFAEAKILTLVMAVGLGVTLAFASHFLGVFIRHKERLGWQIGIATVVILVLFGIAYVRMSYISTAAADSNAPVIDPKVLMGLFLGINLLLFLVAVVMSIFAHDSDPIFEQVFHDEKRLSAVLLGLNREKSKLSGERISNKEVASQKMLIVGDVYQSVIFKYRKHNIRYRKPDDKEVDIFDVNPVLEIPKLSFQKPEPE